MKNIKVCVVRLNSYNSLLCVYMTRSLIDSANCSNRTISGLWARSIGLSPSTLRNWVRSSLHHFRINVADGTSSMLAATCSAVQFSLSRLERSAPASTKIRKAAVRESGTQTRTSLQETTNLVHEG